MKVTTISFQKIFPTSMQYMNERIGMEAELEEGEDAIEKMMELKAKVLQCAPEILQHFDHSEKLLNLDVPYYQEQQPERTTEVPKTREGRIEQLKKDIATSPDLITLKAYQLLAKTHPEIQEAYDKKLKEFQE